VIDASWRALVDALRLELMRLVEKDKTANPAVRDFSWAV
jgi:2-isopropylmalate synthase